jgi:hypothetical protein
MKGTTKWQPLDFEKWLANLTMTADVEHLPLGPESTLSGGANAPDPQIALAFKRDWHARFGNQGSMLQMATNLTKLMSPQGLDPAPWYLHPFSQVEMASKSMCRGENASERLTRLMTGNQKRLGHLKRFLGKSEWPLLVRIRYDRECTVLVENISAPVPTSALALSPTSEEDYTWMLADKDQNFAVMVGVPGSVSFQRAARIVSLPLSLWRIDRSVLFLEWIFAGRYGHFNALARADDFLSNRSYRLTQSFTRKLVRMARGEALTTADMETPDC